MLLYQRHQCQHTAASSHVLDTLSSKSSEVLEHLLEHSLVGRRPLKLCSSSVSYWHCIAAARKHGISLSILRPVPHFGGTTKTVGAILGTSHWSSGVLKDCKQKWPIPEGMKQIHSNKTTGASTGGEVATKVAKKSPDIEIGDFRTPWRLTRGAHRRDDKRSELQKAQFKLQVQLLESVCARLIVKWKNGGHNGWTLQGMALQQKLQTGEKWPCFAVGSIESEEGWPGKDNFSSHLGKAHVVGHHAKAIDPGSRSSLYHLRKRINTNRGCDISTNEYAIVMDKAFKVHKHEGTGKLSNETIDKSACSSGRLNGPSISYNNRMMVFQGTHGNWSIEEAVTVYKLNQTINQPTNHGNRAAIPANFHGRREYAENNFMQSLRDDSKRPQPRPPMMSPDDDDDDETIGFQRATCSQPHRTPTKKLLWASHTSEHPKCTKCAHRVCTCCRSAAFRQNSDAQKHGYAARDSTSKKDSQHRRWYLQCPTIVHQWRAVIAQTCGGHIAGPNTVDRTDRYFGSIDVAG